MKYQVKTEKELAPELLRDGIYDFEIMEASDTTSKAGNEMIKLKLRVFDEAGNPRTIFDYLLSDESAAYKLRHCADSCGILEKYEGGEMVADDFIGGTGKCKIRISKNKDGNYPDNNTVADYIKQSASDKADPDFGDKRPKRKELDDEIPF